jgi:uncharacterized protein YegJ (DUF2314 family)
MKNFRVPIIVLLVICVSALFLGRFFGGSGSIKRVNHQDPRLIQAIREARAGLPTFLKELHDPMPDQRFAVMCQFKTPEGNEYLWIKDPVPEGDNLSGTLDQEPVAVSHHKGDTISVSQADIVDWLVKEPDGSMKGRFTEAANKP